MALFTSQPLNREFQSTYQKASQVPPTAIKVMKLMNEIYWLVIKCTDQATSCLESVSKEPATEVFLFSQNSFCVKRMQPQLRCVADSQEIDDCHCQTERRKREKSPIDKQCQWCRREKDREQDLLEPISLSRFIFSFALAIGQLSLVKSLFCGISLPNGR